MSRILRDKNKYKLPVTRCRIWKATGHPTKFCLKRVPSAHSLGLVYHGELLLYQFLYKIKISPIPIIDWNDIPSVSKVQENAIKKEKTFFQMLSSCFKSRNYPDWRYLFNPHFFSKGRQTLGSQWAMGSFRWQLMISTFGCTIDLSAPLSPLKLLIKTH